MHTAVAVQKRPIASKILLLKLRIARRSSTWLIFFVICSIKCACGSSITDWCNNGSLRCMVGDKRGIFKLRESNENVWTSSKLANAVRLSLVPLLDKPQRPMSVWIWVTDWVYSQTRKRRACAS